jgi:hypothetical protein
MSNKTKIHIIVGILIASIVFIDSLFIYFLLFVYKGQTPKDIDNSDTRYYRKLSDDFHRDYPGGIQDYLTK